MASTYFVSTTLALLERTNEYRRAIKSKSGGRIKQAAAGKLTCEVLLGLKYLRSVDSFQS